jgi:hypothetical protein
MKTHLKRALQEKDIRKQAEAERHKIMVAFQFTCPQHTHAVRNNYCSVYGLALHFEKPNKVGILKREQKTLDLQFSYHDPPNKILPCQHSSVQLIPCSNKFNEKECTYDSLN